MGEVRAHVVLGDSNRFATTAPVHQWDHGISISVTGIDNLSFWNAHFANEGRGFSLKTVGRTSGKTVIFDIPDILLVEGENIMCYVYRENTTSGYTGYTIRIPVIRRAKPDTTTYTPEQTAAFDALMAELQSRIDAFEEIVGQIKIYAVDDSQGNVTLKTK